MALLRLAARLAVPVIYVAWLLLPLSSWAADVRYVVKPIAEMKVKQLPRGPLYWGSRISRRWIRLILLRGSTVGIQIL